jgi:signal transduction histidine kinase
MRLRRVVGNLLANAVKYSPDGGCVTAAVALLGDQGSAARTAVLRVTDAGIGIPATELAHITEPFYRASNAVGRARGSGVGLAGARQIVEQHGGRLTIESEEGAGTTVSVFLPLE